MKVHKSIISGAIRRNPATYRYRRNLADHATKAFIEGGKHARAMSSTGSTSGPSQVKGHAAWIRGAMNEMVGQISGSDSWKSAGRTDQAHAVAEMRAAKAEGDAKMHLENRGPTILQTEGKMEGVAGMMLGCQGLKERGQQKCETADKKKST